MAVVGPRNAYIEIAPCLVTRLLQNHSTFNVSETWGGGADTIMKMAHASLYFADHVLQCLMDRVIILNTFQCLMQSCPCLASESLTPTPIFHQLYFRLNRPLPSMLLSLLSFSSEVMTAFRLPSATVWPC